MTGRRDGARILGLGEHRPARVVSNADLPAELDTSDEWIASRTGIRARRLAADDESIVAMAADAAGKACADAGITPGDVDLVLLATCSMPSSIPGGAAEVATLLGAPAGAFDVNAACAGFCYALAAAADMVRAGSARHVVVAASERLSDVTDWSDRRSAVLFGDGAAAAVVGPSYDEGSWIGPVVWGSDGAKRDLITMPPGGKLGLDGPAVFRWATTQLTETALAACAAAGVSPADLVAFVPHQANLRIVTAIARSLGAGDDLVVGDDVVDMGNTSAASVPLALHRLRADGRVGTGDPALLLAFGAGLTYAAQVVTVP